MKPFSFLLIAAAAGLSAGVTVDFSYDNRSAWQYFCDSSCGRLRQSPIDIVIGDVQESEVLIDLSFTRWESLVNGNFNNTGHSVQFTPTNGDTATVENHQGTYEVQQFHFHWGSEDGVGGSEHRVNGDQFDAELHFVTLKRGETADSDAGDAFSVVAVFFDIDSNAEVTGIWEQLMPMPTGNGATISVTNLRYSDLLPDNRDYYYYEGSLTTPLCNETVQWFVLKEPISIPAAVVASFRRVVEDDLGTLLTENFRDAQALNGRTVQTPQGSGTSNVYKACAVTFVLAVILSFVFTY